MRFADLIKLAGPGHRVDIQEIVAGKDPQVAAELDAQLGLHFGDHREPVPGLVTDIGDQVEVAAGFDVGAGNAEGRNGR